MHETKKRPGWQSSQFVGLAGVVAACLAVANEAGDSMVRAAAMIAVGLAALGYGLGPGRTQHPPEVDMDRERWRAEFDAWVENRSAEPPPERPIASSSPVTEAVS